MRFFWPFGGWVVGVHTHCGISFLPSLMGFLIWQKATRGHRPRGRVSLQGSGLSILGTAWGSSQWAVLGWLLRGAPELRFCSLRL